MTPDEIRAARKELGLNQSQLAERLNLGKGGGNTVSRWERDPETSNSHKRIPGPAIAAIEMMLKLSRMARGE